jgi:hypothetical protein
MQEEIWKEVVGYEGLYQVSNLGRVKSLKFGKEKTLRAGKTQKGYLVVVLWKDAKSKSKMFINSFQWRFLIINRTDMY